MSRRTLLSACLFATALTAASGCLGRAAREGLGIITGAKGSWTELKAISAGPGAKPLGIYQRFEVGEMTDDMYNKAPLGLRAGLVTELQRELREKNIPNMPSGKTLLVQGKILHYEDSSLTGQVFGPLEEVVARIELVDKDSGAVVGVANCVGRTQESGNVGVQKKAEGLAKAIAGWIEKNYSKAEGRSN